MVLDDDPTSDEIEKCLVTSINRRILFAVSLVIIRAKPEDTSYAEYCHELSRNTYDVLKQNDPYGVLRLHQKQSILNCIKELLPVSTKRNDSIDSAGDISFNKRDEESQNIPFENFQKNTLVLDNDASNKPNEFQETEIEWESQQNDLQFHDSGVHSDLQHHDRILQSINTKTCGSEAQLNTKTYDSTLDKVKGSQDIQQGDVMFSRLLSNQHLDQTHRGIETKEQKYLGIQNNNSGQNEVQDDSIKQKLEHVNASMDVLFHDEETNPPLSFQNTTKEIRNDIEFLKTILSLKSQLKLSAEISTNSLLNILLPSSIQCVSNNKYSKISSQIVENKLQQLNSEQMIETMFGQVFEFLQDKMFSDLEYLRNSLLFYKGSDLEMYIDSILELLPLCPKHFHYKTFQFIQKQTKTFFLECDITFKHETLEQIVFLLLKLCHTKLFLIKLCNYIFNALNSLVSKLKHLPSIDSIANEPKLLQRLQNSAYLLSMAKQCVRQMTSNEKDHKNGKETKELGMIIIEWRKINRKIIRVMKEHLFLYVIESDGLFAAKMV